MKKTVVIGLVGPTLDSDLSHQRWNRWRPSVALCQQEDLLVDRFELLYQQRHQRLVDIVSADIQSISPETLLQQHKMKLAKPWDFEEVYGELHNFALHYSFDLEKEDYLVHITTGTHVVQICLFLLTESRFFPARLLQTSPLGHSNQQQGVGGTHSIIDLDLSRYDRLAQRFHQQQQTDLSFLKAGIETRNPAFNQLMEEIELVAIRSQAPFLLTGPTGTGKTQLARRIYELKKNHHQIQGPLVEINCATLRGDSAMSTLFGHTKGAFTGAQTARKGVLLRAHNGLLFLDEIGELGLDEQSMILRAIEERRFLPMGADQEVQSNFQLIAGTNQNLNRAVTEGRFREDLLARITLWHFALKGLVDRPEDIAPNIHFELTRFGTLEGRRLAFSKEALQTYLNFAVSKKASWRGNFRDLRGSITRLGTLANSGRITLTLVQQEIARLQHHWFREVVKDWPMVGTQVLDKVAWNALDTFDTVQLEYVISVCQKAHSLSEAGRLLFNTSRLRRKSRNDADRLKKYLAKFGLDWEKVN